MEKPDNKSKLLVSQLTLNDIEEILQKPFSSNDNLDNLYELWNRLPVCAVFVVVASTIQELQYYKQKYEKEGV